MRWTVQGKLSGVTWVPVGDAEGYGSRDSARDMAAYLSRHGWPRTRVVDTQREEVDGEWSGGRPAREGLSMGQMTWEEHEPEREDINCERRDTFCCKHICTECSGVHADDPRD